MNLDVKQVAEERVTIVLVLVRSYSDMLIDTLFSQIFVNQMSLRDLWIGICHFLFGRKETKVSFRDAMLLLNFFWALNTLKCHDPRNKVS